MFACLELHFVDPNVKVKILNIYATSFYGSGLWDIYGYDCNRFFTAWNSAIRQIFTLPWTTHRYWIEPISNCLHPKVMLCARYIKFVKTLTSSTKSAVRFLSRLYQNDLRTVLGKTLENIRAECGMASIAELTPDNVKKQLKYCEIPAEVEWRKEILSEILLARDGHLVVENFSYDELNLILEDLCTG